MKELIQNPKRCGFCVTCLELSITWSPNLTVRLVTVASLGEHLWQSLWYWPWIPNLRYFLVSLRWELVQYSSLCTVEQREQELMFATHSCRSHLKGSSRKSGCPQPQRTKGSKGSQGYTRVVSLKEGGNREAAQRVRTLGMGKQEADYMEEQRGLCWKEIFTF